jgi:hypothetical protein
MLLLTKGTGHLVQITTDASGDIESDVAYVDKIAGTGGFQYNYTGAGEPLASITSATTITTIAGAASTERAIERLSYYNNHASTSVTCTIQILDGTDTVTLAKCVLAAGETLYMNAAGDWFHLDANGGPYVGVGPIATQAEMEAGTSTTVVVTPGRQHFHKSAVKSWGQFTNAGATTAGYNVDTPTDNGTGDITVNFTTDYSAANAYSAVVSVEMTATTYAVANARTPHIRSAGLAAGTVRCDCIDGTTITQLVKDPTSWHVQSCGDFA